MVWGNSWSCHFSLKDTRCTIYPTRRADKVNVLIAGRMHMIPPAQILQTQSEARSVTWAGGLRKGQLTFPAACLLPESNPFSFLSPAVLKWPYFFPALGHFTSACIIEKPFFRNPGCYTVVFEFMLDLGRRMFKGTRTTFLLLLYTGKNRTT